ncbi:MAG TPA: hypothetical protein P5521_00120 [Candidatus Omnitrophota bacterium]|nr:hypothetical protein [Candidatus Omnitrophota bacterium]HRZ66517.1 hypothetical protein [Candidatus Omnitrophota bacterium]
MGAILPILIVGVAVGIPIFALIRFGKAAFLPEYRKLIKVHPLHHAILAVLALFFIVIDIVFISSFGWPTRRWEDISYKQYKKIHGTGEPGIALPESSEHINIYCTAGIDVSHEYVQAKAKQEDVDLKKIVTECGFSDLSDPIFITNAPYSSRAFLEVFGSNKNVKWWVKEGDFETNELMFTYDDGYGYGCWAFYNKKTQTLSVFRWGQQWLSDGHFKEAFGIK